MGVTPFTGSQASERRPAEAAAGAAGGAQLGRLFRLILLLQTERYPNARELAEQCEVSRRTIYRDLDVISDAGIPVRYRPDRQGYQLDKGFFLTPTALDEVEALALLVLARQWRVGGGLGLLRHAWGGAVKVAQGLPPEARERVLTAAEPFRTEDRLGEAGADRRAVHEAVLAAAAGSRQVRVWYLAADGETVECTKFSPYRLTLHGGHWFMVGRSSLHRRVEVIGVPWVRRVVLTEDGFTTPPRFNLERFLGQAWGVDRDPVRYRVRLRFSARVAPELNDHLWHCTQKRVDLADGRVELQFALDGIEEVSRWVLGFGDQVEVLEPGELRDRVFGVSARVARRHRPERKLGARPAVGG